jgi:hypothetical protein
VTRNVTSYPSRIRDIGGATVGTRQPRFRFGKGSQNPCKGLPPARRVRDCSIAGGPNYFQRRLSRVLPGVSVLERLFRFDPRLSSQDVPMSASARQVPGTTASRNSIPGDPRTDEIREQTGRPQFQFESQKRPTHRRLLHHHNHLRVVNNSISVSADQNGVSG